MAIDPQKKRYEVNYLSDNTQNYALVQSKAHADAAAAEPPETANIYPRHWTPRKVHGISADGLQHASLVIPDPVDEIFIGATAGMTFNLNYEGGDTEYTVTGRSGEKRPNLSQPLE